ncbi:MAG: NUDIX domain-containing protein [Thermoplasmataceae archaeon]
MLRTGSAAVSLITDSKSILFIKRKDREDDPWSGNIALPGGFLKKGETPEEAAIRETLEETSVSINEGQITARMGIMHSKANPKISIYPIAFSLENFPAYSPGDEVAEVRLIGIKDLEYSSGPESHGAAYVNEGWVIWGLTYRIIRKYFGLD